MQFSLISRQPQHQLWGGRLLKAAKTGSECHPFCLLGNADFVGWNTVLLASQEKMLEVMLGLLFPCYDTKGTRSS